MAPNSRGVALATVLLALVLIGAVVAVTFVPALEELRAGRNTVKLVQAAAAAEAGVDEVLANWADGGFDTLRSGDSASVGASALLSRSGWYAGIVERVGANSYVIRVEGFSRDSVARQPLAALVRQVPFDVGLRSALSAEGPVQTSSSAQIAEESSLPEDWLECPVPMVSQDGPVDDAMVRARFDSALQRVTSLRRRELPARAVAEIRLEPGFPIIESDGDLTLSGGLGRGILVVHGALTLEDGAEFQGLILVEGPFHLNGAKVLGGVEVGGQSAVRLENGRIGYSKCLIAMSSAVLGEARKITSRWSVLLP